MCEDCNARRQKIRDDWVNSRIAAAAKNVLVGAAEALGLKEKTALVEDKPQEPAVAESYRSRQRLVPSEVVNSGDAG